MSSNLAEIGSRLLKKRKELGYSQAKIAAKLDVSDGSYKSYELGKRDMPLAIAMKFAELFGVSLDWLAFGQGEENLKRVDDLLLEVSTLSFAYISSSNQRVSAEQYKSYVEYIVSQIRKNGSSAQTETESFFKTLGIINEK